MKLFTDTQLANALNAYGTSNSAHVARLIALADMQATEDATIDDIAWSIRHAAACTELGVPFDDTSAATKRAAERIVGYSDSTFQRYSIVLGWLATSLSDEETLTGLLTSDTFTADALSALCQLATGKVATRKVAADTVASHIAKRDSAKIVAAYRRLLAASNAKAKAKRERAERAKVAKVAKSAEESAPIQTAEDILASVSVAELADMLVTRLAAEFDSLSEADNERVIDALAQLEAMITA